MVAFCETLKHPETSRFPSSDNNRNRRVFGPALLGTPAMRVERTTTATCSPNRSSDDSTGLRGVSLRGSHLLRVSILQTQSDTFGSKSAYEQFSCFLVIWSWNYRYNLNKYPPNLCLFTHQWKPRCFIVGKVTKNTENLLLKPLCSF